MTTVPPTNTIQPVAESGTTGRHLVLLRDGAFDEGMNALNAIAGLGVARATDLSAEAMSETLSQGGTAIMLETLGVAIINVEPDQIQSLSVASAEAGPILAVEPERVVYALADGVFGSSGFPEDFLQGPIGYGGAPGVGQDYLLGYRDGVDNLVNALLAPGSPAQQAATGAAALWNETQVTWGLQVTRV